MNALILVGSPKARKSASNNIASYIEDKFNEKHVKAQISYIANQQDPEKLRELVHHASKTELLLLIAPLYVDSIPAIAINFMEQYYTQYKSNHAKGQKLMAIFNSGFPEPHQNDLAIDMCKNFADKTNMEWIGGVTIGMGAAFENTRLEESGGMGRNLRNGLNTIIESLAHNKPIPPEAFITASKPLLPLTISKIGIRYLVNKMWKNQVKDKNLRKKMYNQPYKRNIIKT